MVCSIIELLMATVVKLVNTLDCGSSISWVRVPSVAPDPSDEGFFVVYKIVFCRSVIIFNHYRTLHHWISYRNPYISMIHER